MNSFTAEQATFAALAAATTLIAFRIYWHLSQDSLDHQHRVDNATRSATTTRRRRSSSGRLLTRKKSAHSIPPGNDFLSLDALAQLTRCDNVNLQESALQLLLDRAMSKEYLPHIVNACRIENDAETRLKGIATVQQLTKSEQNRNELVKAGILRILVDLLNNQDNDDETVTRYVLVALFRIVSNKDTLKVKLIEYKVLDPLLKLLNSTPTHSNDLKYWALLMLHQFCLQEELHVFLLAKKVINILATMTRLTFGNSNMQKLCLHSLVRLISSLDKTHAVNELNELVSMNMVPLICACIRNDDVELSSWAAFVLHEFVTRDVAREEFAASKGLAKILASMLGGGDETCIPRVTLRSLKCLGLSHEDFQNDMLRAGVLKKVLSCLSSADEDTRYWALAVLHDLIGHTDCHEDFLANKGLEILIARVPLATTHESLYIADIFVCLCSSVKTHESLESSGMTEAVMILSRSSEFELQYAGIAILLNMSTIGEKMILSILEAGGIQLLITTMLDVTKESLHTICAKTLTTISRKMPSLRRHIISVAIRPLITRILLIGPKCVMFIFRKHQKENGGTARSPLLESFMATYPSGAAFFNEEHSASTIQPESPTDSNPAEQRASPTEEMQEILPIRRLSVVIPPALSVSSDSPVSQSPDRAAFTPIEESVEESVPTSPTPTPSSSKPNSSTISAAESVDEWNSTIQCLASHIDCLFAFLTHKIFDGIDPNVQNSYFSVLDEDLGGVEDAIVFQLESLITLLVDIIVVFAIIPNNEGKTAIMKSPVSAASVARSDKSHLSSSVGSKAETAKSSVVSSPRGSPIEPTPRSLAVVSPTLSNSPVSAAASATSSPSPTGYQAPSKSVAEASASDGDLQSQYLTRLTQNAAGLLGTLAKYPTAQKIFAKEKVAHLLLQALEIHMDQDYVAAISDCAVLGGVVSKSMILEHAATFNTILRNLKNPDTSPHCHFFSLRLFEQISDWTIPPPLSYTLPISIIAESTPYLTTASYGRDVWNHSWTFESLRARFGCHASNKAAVVDKVVYEVVLRTEGIIQIGWASEDCVCDPEGGTGIGDDEHSYAFDGFRRKKWHGADPKDNAYGDAWASGDIITSLLDLTTREIRYWRNGIDMGVAFENVDTDVTWYPAISLSSQQGCLLYFGGALDKITYLPEGFTPIARVSEWKPSSRSLSHEEDETRARSLNQTQSKQSVYELAPESLDDVAEPQTPPLSALGLAKSETPVSSTFSLQHLRIVIDYNRDADFMRPFRQVGFIATTSCHKYVLEIDASETRIVTCEFDIEGVYTEDEVTVLSSVPRCVLPGDVVGFRGGGDEVVQFVVNGADFGPPIRVEKDTHLPYISHISAYRLLIV
ncbi:hypothetical protein SmJEL517_g04134 [Synchytrium microbalum]|uniref:B30.2/SPRY domain-containing protein n=1 Tax=Synchytrium microbalum TaxID=1806994 RepID=A0A507C081_9FUNG|nr:uncharacterized protein SmJEL517_g04134 [Synchytrium microbalum]TPX32811.1 hypothetical protein SmJEL517_g04134 [Synchytrium microbalum]